MEKGTATDCVLLASWESVPVTVTLLLPAVAPVVLTVSVVLALLPLVNVTLVGLKLHALAASPPVLEQLKFTIPLVVVG